MNANRPPKQVFNDITYELDELLEHIIVHTDNASKPEVSIDLKEKSKDGKIDIMNTITDQGTNKYISAVSELNNIKYKLDILIPPTCNDTFSKNEALDDKNDNADYSDVVIVPDAADPPPPPAAAAT